MMVLLEIILIKEARPFLMAARKSYKGSLSTEETEIVFSFFFFFPKANPVFKQEPNDHLCGLQLLLPSQAFTEA